MKQQKIFFEDSNRNKICGILSNPTGTSETPIVILCHGFSTSKDNYTNMKLEKILNLEDIPIFRFDFYAHGESQGSVEDTTLDKWVEDILSACSYLNNLGFSKIGLFASSFSGPAATIAASKRKDIIFLALKSPGMGQTSRKRPLIREDFEKGTWFNAAENVNIPALVVQGDSDKDVELEQGKKLASSLQRSRFEIIQDADHTYSNSEHYDKMLNLISKFIIEKSGK